MTHTLLLEVGLEEMPANVIQTTEEQLAERMMNFLNEQRIEFSNLEVFSTPRRFAIKVYELADKQKDVKSIVRGPARQIAQDEEGKWTKAAQGFAKGQQATVEDIIFKEDNDKEYTFIEKFIKGQPTKEILTELAEVITHMEFSKNMKWGTTHYQYIRPVHWVVALLDDELIPFEVFDVPTSNVTYGHRFLSEGPLSIEKAADYEEVLLDHFVDPVRSHRKATIEEQIEAIAADQGWASPNEYPDLLEEVIDLTEWPTAFVADFDPDFLEVFDLILETSMINHQRYFPVKASDSRDLLPHFIGVRNGDDRSLELVAKGNEKVLTARLADAKFFYQEDQKATYDEWNEKLKQLTFHDKLGSVYAKQKRVEVIAKLLSQKFDLSDKEQKQFKRAAEIYKTDLVSEVVNEFPELQGRIGGQYALERDEDEAVATAISEQYLPTSTDGDLPQSKLGALLSVADKLDTLSQFFAVGLIPTGSNDPFALRRQAMGIVRIVMEIHQPFAIAEALDEIMSHLDLTEEVLAGYQKNRATLLAFINDRIDQYIREHTQVSPDLIKATRGAQTTDIVEKVEIVHALNNFKQDDHYKEKTESIKRVLNLTKDFTDEREISVDQFETTSEQQLFTALKELENKWDQDEFNVQHISLLTDLSPYIDKFFEENMVMVEDESIRNNRLSLLNRIATLAQSVADFSELVI